MAGPTSFSVGSKHEMRVVIREAFEERESQETASLLTGLDPPEQGKVDLIRVVRSESTYVPIPAIEKMPETRALFLRNGVAVGTRSRQFGHSSDFFAPLRYRANEGGVAWMARWNRSHKFLAVSKRAQNEKFVRTVVRRVRRAAGVAAALVVEAPPVAVPPLAPDPDEQAPATIPGPPTSPSFLKWYMRRG